MNSGLNSSTMHFGSQQRQPKPPRYELLTPNPNSASNTRQAPTVTGWLLVFDAFTGSSQQLVNGLADHFLTINPCGVDFFVKYSEHHLSDRISSDAREILSGQRPRPSFGLVPLSRPMWHKIVSNVPLCGPCTPSGQLSEKVNYAC